MIRWIESLSAWNGAAPAVLTRERLSREDRHALLHAMVVKAVNRTAADVEIVHGRDRPPSVARPIGSGLYLSSASRDGFTALAVADRRVGVDVEIAAPEAPIPRTVLHPIEAAALDELHGLEQARAFARVWSLKGAYLKALGLGLKREPSSFVVQSTGEDRAVITDPFSRETVAEAATQWRGVPAGWAAVSVVML
ncbi:MAG TPA: 4'-phosphopantetheinyl transferase superfamily protein [Microvirga sp.]|jgi:phosphopantetheinyl transferase